MNGPLLPRLLDLVSFDTPSTCDHRWTVRAVEMNMGNETWRFPRFVCDNCSQARGYFYAGTVDESHISGDYRRRGNGSLEPGDASCNISVRANQVPA